MGKNKRVISILVVLFSIVLIAWNYPIKKDDSKLLLNKKNYIQTKAKSLIYHKVKDYDKWKEAFDEFLPIREANGELSYEVGILEDDPNTVYVLNTWKSKDDYNKFKETAALKDKMNEAGVSEAPTFLYLNQLEGSEFEDKKITAIIYHEVEDYDKWKRAFDNFERTRKEFNEVSYEVGTINGDSKWIYVLNQWDNYQDYKTFIEDAKLKEVMTKAGVIGKPVFLVFNPKEKG
tara:strand:+ start:59075 stop:59773 length:699 start_codon:yes stop_codon:yes gene_type:complete